MKKYLSIFLILLFLVGVVSPTFAVNDAVTDEVRAEIEELFERYNEYVLISNCCNGSIDIDDEVLIYFELPLEAYIYDHENVTILDKKAGYTEVTETAYHGEFGYLVTDERYKSQEDIYELLRSIYTDELAFLHFRADIDHTPIFNPDSYNAYIILGTEYMDFNKDGTYVGYEGSFFTLRPQTDFAILEKRYIDLGSLIIQPTDYGYYVSARGSSEFRDSEVQPTDSDLIFYLVEEDGEIRIEKMDAKRDHMDSDFLFNHGGESDDADSIGYLMRNLNMPNEVLLSNINGDYEYIINNNYFIPAQSDIHTVVADYTSWYKLNVDDRSYFQNFADIYDWAYNIFTPEAAELFFCRYFRDGLTYTGMVTDVSSIEGKHYRNSMFVNTPDGIYYYHLYNDLDILRWFRNNKFTSVETSDGYIAYNSYTMPEGAGGGESASFSYIIPETYGSNGRVLKIDKITHQDFTSISNLNSFLNNDGISKYFRRYAGSFRSDGAITKSQANDRLDGGALKEYKILDWDMGAYTFYYLTQDELNKILEKLKDAYALDDALYYVYRGY